MKSTQHKSTIATLLTSLFAITVAATPVFARGYVDVGFNVGAFWVTDPAISSIFGKDLGVFGKLGFADLENNWEILAKVGHYQAISTQPEDAGKNFKMSITPLSGSLIYHFGDRDGTIQPYLGAGVDAYFYGFQDDVVGVLETGTRFGLHYLAGVRFNLNSKVAITAEYIQNISPRPVYFNGSQNFDSRAVTVGLSFNLQPILTKNGTETSPESRYQDQMLDEIKSIQTDIKKMKENRESIESKIDAFYESDDLEVSTGILTALQQKIANQGSGIKILDPSTGIPIATGIIDSIDTNASKTRITIKNTDGWALIVDVTPESVSIADKVRPEFNAKTINTAIVIVSARDEKEFARQLRTVQYLQGKLKGIDEKIAKAEAYLNTLREKWNQKPSEPVVQSTTYRETVVVQSDLLYYPRYPHPRFYESRDYIVPQTVIVTTPLSAEEREAYFKKKQEYIKASKARR